jgi:hypothetical protein
MAGAQTEMRTEEYETSLTAHAARSTSMASLVEDSRRAPFIVFQQSTKQLIADYILKLKLLRRCWLVGIDRHVTPALVRALKMVASSPAPLCLVPKIQLVGILPQGSANTRPPAAEPRIDHGASFLL